MSKGMLPQMRLGSSQYAILAITLLVALPVVMWFAIGNLIHDYYVDQVVAPPLQEEFRFQVGLVRTGPDESGEDKWEAITEIAAGSPPRVRGVRRGDTGCLGLDTGGMHDVYAALERLRQQPEVTLSLSNTVLGRQPCRTVTVRR
jgi:hypothetical protein